MAFCVRYRTLYADRFIIIIFLALLATTFYNVLSSNINFIMPIQATSCTGAGEMTQHVAPGTFEENSNSNFLVKSVNIVHCGGRTNTRTQCVQLPRIVAFFLQKRIL